MGIYEELVWRGLIKDVSSPELKDKLNNGLHGQKRKLLLIARLVQCNQREVLRYG